MKSFLEHLTESEKTYDFRIKIANIEPKDIMDKIENALNAYELVSISGPKRLPIKDSDIDFPSIKNCQLYILEVTVKYPVNDAQLSAILSSRAAIPASNLVVVPTGHAEETWRWDRANSDIREYKQGESVLDQQELDDNPAGKQAGEDYSNASFLKSLRKTPEWELAKEEGGAVKDTNSLPQNNTSPIKGK